MREGWTTTPPLFCLSDNVGTAADGDADVVVDVVIVSAVTSPSAPWTISPPPRQSHRRLRARCAKTAYVAMTLMTTAMNRPSLRWSCRGGCASGRSGGRGSGGGSCLIRRGRWTTCVTLLRRQGHGQGRSRRPDNDAPTGWSRLLAGGRVPPPADNPACRAGREGEDEGGGGGHGRRRQWCRIPPRARRGGGIARWIGRRRRRRRRRRSCSRATPMRPGWAELVAPLFTLGGV